ncbi:MAG TPA: hypothetical protein VE944_19320 [Nostoc sp.]|uniref:hypothetical protein n=1 Tax=Nostoc sp. TaxID=1180 RepID=UPI002D4E1372|nr:hypothetical protein [Nostoc sp.]HYX16473.1 hypothetical protein [Nostoc sp.]
MTRFITVTGNIQISEVEYLASQLTDYSEDYSLAISLLNAVTQDTYNFADYIGAKRRLSCYLNVDMCEISRLCILARQVKTFFDNNDGSTFTTGYTNAEIGYTMTVTQLVSALLSLPNQNAFVSFYAPESPCSVKSVHAPVYDTSHVYLDYKA